MESYAFNIDFDGTCVTHEFPKVGKDIGAEEVLKELIERGHRLILFTMRSDKSEVQSDNPDIVPIPGHYLTDAINWFKKRGIRLYGINSHPDQESWTDSPKSYARYMIDDSAIGCPLVYPKNGDRPYVDWVEIRNILVKMGILTNYNGKF